MPKSAHHRLFAWHRPRHVQPGALEPTRTAVAVKVAAVGALVAAGIALVITQGAGGATTPASSTGSNQPTADANSTVQDLRVSAAPIAVAVTVRLPRHRATTAPAVPASDLAADGIPATALLAYRQAAARERATDPACGISWPLLAAIGRVESDHGRFAGAILHTDGLSTPRVIGPALDGVGTALIRDTDHGRLDGDRIYDHAVGPMQFIPSTWAIYGVDVTGSGTADPFNIFDAAAAAARYLCAAGGTLTTLDGQRRAILAYNQSDAYERLVLSLEALYARGVLGVTVPVLPANPGPVRPPALPPVDPGPPPALTAVRTSHSPTHIGPAGLGPSSSTPVSAPDASTSASTSGGSSAAGSSSASATSSTPSPSPDPSSSLSRTASSSTAPAPSPSSSS